MDEQLNRIEKKLDKTLNLLTKIAKTLHLVPVTEKEEREIAIMQRKNFAQSSKIESELDAIENKTPDPSLFGVNEYTARELFSDVLGDDILGDRQ